MTQRGTAFHTPGARAWRRVSRPAAAKTRKLGCEDLMQALAEPELQSEMNQLVVREGLKKEVGASWKNQSIFGPTIQVHCTSFSGRFFLA